MVTYFQVSVAANQQISSRRDYVGSLRTLISLPYHIRSTEVTLKLKILGQVLNRVFSQSQVTYLELYSRNTLPSTLFCLSDKFPQNPTWTDTDGRLGFWVQE